MARAALSPTACSWSGINRRGSVTEKHTAGCRPNRPLGMAGKIGNSASAAQIGTAKTERRDPPNKRYPAEPAP